MKRRTLLPLLAAPLAARAPEYRLALPGYRYEFPRDHFDHPDFRTEWWYYTGNLRAQDARRFGCELVFFRQGQQRGASANPSAWRVDDLYLAHLALTDVESRRFLSSKRLNRAGPGIAGASLASHRVWNGNWSARWDGDRQILTAVDEDVRFELILTPRKPPVIHGRDGVSQKAGGAGKASHYVSLSRLEVKGRVEAGGAAHEVTGSAWMDHEWFTHQLEATQAGWDWFSIQLEDQRELMLFQLRRKDGSIDPFSAGTYIDAVGRSRHLTLGDFRLTPGRTWTSPKTRARYPVEWGIEAPSLGLKLVARALLDSQELTSTGSGPTYWEGAVDYSGSAPGAGYLEMTGYDKPVTLG